MTRYCLPIVTLAWLVSGLPLAVTDVQAGDAMCCGPAACQSSCDCCPQCGCRLQPVCNTCCETKRTTEYKLGAVCETICIPGITRLCERCGSCGQCGECAGACEGCGDHCRVRNVHKLVKTPVTKEVPVKTCTVEWVCPHCSRCCEGTPAATPTPAPSTTAPAPSPRKLPSAPGRPTRRRSPRRSAIFVRRNLAVGRESDGRKNIRPQATSPAAGCLS